MPSYTIQHAFHGIGGSSKDWYTNTFHFAHSTQVLDSSTNLAYSQGIATMIKNFYGGRDNSVAGIVDYLSLRCFGERTIKIYNQVGPGVDSGPPVYQEDSWVQDAPLSIENVGLPEEVSVCLSYTALTTGSTPARRRGRIYLGPLNVTAIDDISEIDAPCQVVGQCVQAILSQASGLVAALDSAGWRWQVFSRSDNAGHDIVQFSVDDAFDTVRNRGTASVTGRQTYDVP